MIARSDLKKALQRNEAYAASDTLLYSLEIDPRGAEMLADGYALRAIFVHYRLDPGKDKLTREQLDLIELVATAFMEGGACFLRARAEVDAQIRHNGH